jgi:hypothetical protein
MSKTKAEVKPFLVNEDTNAIADTQAGVSIVAGTLQKVIKEYEALGVGEFNASELSAILNDPQSVVNTKCMEKIGTPPEIAGFKVKKQNLIDSLEMPDVSNLQKAVDSFKHFANQYSLGSQPLAHFIIEGNEVKLNESVLKNRLDTYRVYASTENEIQIATEYQEYLESFKKIHARLLGVGVAGGLFAMHPERIVKRSELTGDLGLHVDFYNLINA